MKTSTRPPTLRALLLLAALCCAPAWSQQDKQADKAARRAQMQLQAMQQQLQAAQAEKARVETERAELNKKLDERAQAESRLAAAQRSSNERFKAAESQRTALVAKVAELEAALQEHKRSSDKALAEKDALLAKAARAGTAQGESLAQLQQRFNEQLRLVSECTDKNDRLARLGAELIDRYRNKGVFDAIRQREPVLGLSDVEMFNLVQGWRDRVDAERFTPSVERR